MLRVLVLITGMIIIVQLSGCKKSLGPESFEFSFKYNNVTYKNSDFGFVSINTPTGIVEIEIRKPDVLGGLIHYSKSTNCAFLEPTGMTDYSSPNQVSFNYNTCTYFTTGVVDSSKIFWLNSGSVNYNFVNCRHRKVPNIGGWLEYDECTADGSFSLVLINRTGITKSLTGTFKLPGVHQ